MSSARRTRRSVGRSISRMACLSASLSWSWAAMVSARSPGSSMLCTDARISGARRLSSLTKLEKAACASRAAASASADHSVSSRISSTSTARKHSPSTKRRTTARRLPSTRTFTVPSGRRKTWITLASVPTEKMSSGVGSSLCTRCAERKISWLSPREVTSPSAPSDFSRPTKSGTTIWGKTTVSRRGRSGTQRTPVVWS